MGIGMAGSTALVVEVEDGRTFAFLRFVAINTWDRRVPARQGEPGLLMTGYIERRVVECRFIVTALAVVEVWRSGKLVVVHILMAIDALRCLDPKHCALSCRHMALGASNIGVLGAKRELGLAVVANCEFCRPEAIEGMTRVASTTIGPGQELAIVGVRLVAIRTEVVLDRRLEVAIAVT